MICLRWSEAFLKAVVKNEMTLDEPESRLENIQSLKLSSQKLTSKKCKF